MGGGDYTYLRWRSRYQSDALKRAGCQRIFAGTGSGALDERPELARLMGQLRGGDTLVVWRLDRLGRSLRHLIETVNGLRERGVGFRSLQETIDTATSGGKLVFHLFGALAEFERDIIQERTRAGLEAARARGRSGGRPRAMTPDKVRLARQIYASRDHTVAAIAQTLGVSRASIYRHLEAGATSRPAATRPRRPGHPGHAAAAAGRPRTG